jgi:Mor family transcriptional regulator
MERQYVNIKQEELHPTYQTLAVVIGIEAAVKLGQEFGGTVIYFPRLDALTVSRRKARDKKIVEDYESDQYTKEQLGRKYKMTAMGISSVLKRAKDKGVSNEKTDHKGKVVVQDKTVR